MPDWTRHDRIPRGYDSRHGRVAPLDPRSIQTALFTLAQIGGLYDLIALNVERDHLVMLTEWRLVSGAPRAIDYIRNKHTRATNETKQESETPHA